MERLSVISDDLQLTNCSPLNTRRWRHTHSLLMVLSIEIASALCHRASQEAVNMRAQLTSTLIGLTTQTDAGIVVTSQRQCGRLQRLLPRRGAITRQASFAGFNKAYCNFADVFFLFCSQSHFCILDLPVFYFSNARKNFETCLESYRWHCIGPSCKLS